MSTPSPDNARPSLIAMAQRSCVECGSACAKPASSVHASREQCLKSAEIVRRDYQAQPDLSLTHTQAARLWGFERPLMHAVLEHLLCEGFLHQTPLGTFVRADVARR